MKEKRRIMAILLSLVMVVSYMPALAFAGTEGEDIVDTPAVEESLETQPEASLDGEEPAADFDGNDNNSSEAAETGEEDAENEGSVEAEAANRSNATKSVDIRWTCNDGPEDMYLRSDENKEFWLDGITGEVSTDDLTIQAGVGAKDSDTGKWEWDIAFSEGDQIDTSDENGVPTVTLFGMQIEDDGALADGDTITLVATKNDDPDWGEIVGTIEYCYVNSGESPENLDGGILQWIGPSQVYSNGDAAFQLPEEAVIPDGCDLDLRVGINTGDPDEGEHGWVTDFTRGTEYDFYEGSMTLVLHGPVVAARGDIDAGQTISFFAGVAIDEENGWQASGSCEFVMSGDDISYIEFSSVDGRGSLNDPIQLIEYTNGRWDCHDSGVDYYYYYLGCNDGDIITVHYSDGTQKSFRYDIDSYCFLDNDNNYVDYWAEIEGHQGDWAEGWKIDNTYAATLYFQGATTTLFYKVVESPVKGISFSRNGGVKIREGLDGTNSDGGDEGFFSEYFLEFKEGDTLTLTIQEEGSEETRTETYIAEEYTSEDYDRGIRFATEDNKYIYNGEIGIDSDPQGPENEWKYNDGKDHWFTVSYMGAESEQIPVTMLPNPVGAISFSREGGVTLTEGVDGVNSDGADGEFFEYYFEFKPGDRILVTASNSNLVNTYEAAWKDENLVFVNTTDEEDVIPEYKLDVIPHSDQWDSHWTPGDGVKHFFTLYYGGKYCTVDVTLEAFELRLIPEVLWAGCDYYSPASFNADMEDAELISVTSSEPDVIKVCMESDGEHLPIDAYYLKPLASGKSTITVEYSLNGEVGSASAEFNVKPFPTFASSLTVDGENVDLSEYKNYYTQYNYTGTEPLIKYTPADGWYIKGGYYLLDDGTDNESDYIDLYGTDLENIQSDGLELDFPKDSEAIRVFIEFENDSRETITHSVQLEREEGDNPEESGLHAETVWVDCSYGTYLNLTGDLNNAEITSATSSDPDTISVHEAEWGGFYLLAKKPGTSTITVTYELDGETGTTSAEFTAKEFPSFLESLKIDGKEAGESELKNNYFVYDYNGTNPRIEYTPANGWEIVSVWLTIHEDSSDINVADYVNDPTFAFPADSSEATLDVEFMNDDGETIRHSTTLSRESDWHGGDDEPEYWISTGHADARYMGLPGHEFEMYATPNHGYTDENGEYHEESEGLALRWSYAIASELPDWSVDNDGVEPGDDDWTVVPAGGLSTPFADFTVTGDGSGEETGHLKFKALGTDQSGKDAIENRFFIKVEIVDDEGTVLADDYFHSYNCFKVYEVIYPYELEDSCIEPGEKFEDLRFEVRKYSVENPQTEGNDGYTLLDAPDLTFTWGENEAGSGDVIRITDSNGAPVAIGTPVTENTFTLERLSGDYAGLFLKAEWTVDGQSDSTRNDYVFDQVEVCEHEWDDGVITTPATCTEPGIKTFTCSLCDKKRTEEIAALGHKLSKVDEVPSTCEATGVREHWKCERCGHVFSDAEGANETTLVDLTTPALDHDWGAGEITTPATCTESGVKTFTCSRCGKTRTEEIEAFGHTISKVDAVAAACETTGVSEHWKCDTCGHVFSDAEGKVETTLVNLTIPALGHDWNDVVYDPTPEDFDPDVDESVTASRSCKREACGHTETEVATISKVTEAASCTAPGKVTYTATFTNPAFAKWETVREVESVGHSWGAVTYTWNEDNSQLTAERECSKCNIKETETVAATSEVTKPATCEAKGETTYTSAAFENEAFTAQTKTLEDVPALGHDWGEPTYVWSDDNTKVTATRVCSHADHPETETVEVTAEVTLAPTCMEKGKTTYTSDPFTNSAFKVQTKTLEDIDATGHKYGEWTMLDEDVHQRICENDVSHTDEAAHSWDEGVVTTEPTCGADGVRTYTCSVCGGTKTEVVPATGHHTWSEPTYTRDSFNSKVTAHRACEVCGCEESDVAKLTSVVEKATFDKKGSITYTSEEFTNEAFEKQTYVEEIPVLERKWNEPTYKWSADNTEVTATLTCQNDPDYEPLTETVAASSVTTKAATATEEGEVTWTSAEFTNEAFEVQTKTTVIPKLVSVEEGQENAAATLANADEEIRIANESSNDVLGDANELTNASSPSEVEAAREKLTKAYEDAEVAMKAAEEAYLAAQAYYEAAKAELESFNNQSSEPSGRRSVKASFTGVKYGAKAGTKEEAQEVFEDAESKFAAAKFNNAAANNTLAKTEKAAAIIASIQATRAIETAQQVIDDPAASEADKADAAEAARAAAEEAAGLARDAEKSAADTEGLVGLASADSNVDQTKMAALEGETNNISSEATQARIEAEKLQLTAEELAVVADANSAAETAKVLAEAAQTAVEAAQTALDEYEIAAAEAKELSDKAARTNNDADISRAQAAVNSASAKKRIADEAVAAADAAVTAAEEAIAAANEKIATAETLEDMSDAKANVADADAITSESSADLEDIESSKEGADTSYSESKTNTDNAARASANAKAAAAEAARQGAYDGSISRMKNKKPKASKRAITVKWTKLNKKKLKKSGATNYEIWVCSDGTFARGSTIERVVGKKKSSLKIKGLTKGVTYYTRVRAIKYVGGTKVVGPWSAIKKVKVKK